MKVEKYAVCTISTASIKWIILYIIILFVLEPGRIITFIVFES